VTKPKLIQVGLRASGLADSNVSITTYPASAVFNPKTGVVRGKILKSQTIHNKVVDVGLSMLVEALNTGKTSPVKFFAVGTGSAVAKETDVALAGEVWRDLIISRQLGPRYLMVRYFLTGQQQNGQILREAGVFSLDDRLYARTIFLEDINKSASIAVLFSWVLNWESKT
jgi:hypothetical protein